MQGLETHGLFVCPQLIEDLRKELEHLQLYKLECERPGRGRSSSSSVSEFNAKTREVEMEHEIKRLKQVSWEGPLDLCERYRAALEYAGSCNAPAHCLKILSPLSHTSTSPTLFLSRTSLHR